MKNVPTQVMMAKNAAGIAYTVTVTLPGGSQIGPHPVANWTDTWLVLRSEYSAGPVMVAWAFVAAFEIHEQ